MDRLTWQAEEGQLKTGLAVNFPAVLQRSRKAMGQTRLVDTDQIAVTAV